VGEKMKIRTFKLNRIAEKNLEFEVHDEHSGKKKGADCCRHALEDGQQQIHRYANIKLGVCQSVDS